MVVLDGHDPRVFVDSGVQPGQWLHGAQTGSHTGLSHDPRRLQQVFELQRRLIILHEVGGEGHRRGLAGTAVVAHLQDEGAVDGSRSVLIGQTLYLHLCALGLRSLHVRHGQRVNVATSWREAEAVVGAGVGEEVNTPLVASQSPVGGYFVGVPSPTSGGGIFEAFHVHGANSDESFQHTLDAGCGGEYFDLSRSIRVVEVHSEVPSQSRTALHLLLYNRVIHAAVGSGCLCDHQQWGIAGPLGINACGINVSHLVLNHTVLSHDGAGDIDDVLIAVALHEGLDRGIGLCSVALARCVPA